MVTDFINKYERRQPEGQTAMAAASKCTSHARSRSTPVFFLCVVTLSAYPAPESRHIGVIPRELAARPFRCN
jgi:hypothetical protein